MEFNKFGNTSSAPVSANNSLNNCTNSPSSNSTGSNGLHWKSKANPLNTILSGSEIKEKALQFRSTKYMSNKPSALVKASSMNPESSKKGF